MPSDPNAFLLAKRGGLCPWKDLGMLMMLSSRRRFFGACVSSELESEATDIVSGLRRAARPPTYNTQHVLGGGAVEQKE